MKNIKRLNKTASALSILGCIGFIATAVMAAKETPKALKLANDAKKEKEEELTIAESVIVMTPAYAPAILTGVGSVMCILGANVLNKKAQASLMSAYTMASNAYREYRKKNIELFGDENDKEIMKELARHNSCYHQLGIDTPDAKVRWYEPNSDTFFEAYEREVMDAEYHINRNFVLRSEMSINDILDFFGICHIEDGYENGWVINSGQMWIDFEHEEKEDDKGVYYVINTVYPPEDFSEYY